jgi:hypothetical protein
MSNDRQSVAQWIETEENKLAEHISTLGALQVEMFKGEISLDDVIRHLLMTLRLSNNLVEASHAAMDHIPEQHQWWYLAWQTHYEVTSVVEIFIKTKRQFSYDVEITPKIAGQSVFWHFVGTIMNIYLLPGGMLGAVQVLHARLTGPGE